MHENSISCGTLRMTVSAWSSGDDRSKYRSM